MITDHRIVERSGSRQVPDLIDFFSGKLGYEVLHGLRQKLEAEHQFKSLYEFLTS